MKNLHKNGFDDHADDAGKYQSLRLYVVCKTVTWRQRNDCVDVKWRHLHTYQRARANHTLIYIFMPACVVCVFFFCVFSLYSHCLCAAYSSLNLLQMFVLKTNGKTMKKQRQQPYDYMDIAILHLSIHFISYRGAFSSASAATVSVAWEPGKTTESIPFALRATLHNTCLYLYVYLYTFFLY